MQSNNPVFRRSEAFSGSNAHGNQSYGNSGYGSDPSQWGVGTPGDPQGTVYAPAPQAPSAPMTIDSVVQKTAITLGVVIVTAFATWSLLPEINETSAESAIGTVGAVATFGLQRRGTSLGFLERGVEPRLGFGAVVCGLGVIGHGSGLLRCALRCRALARRLGGCGFLRGGLLCRRLALLGRVVGLCLCHGGRPCPH